MALSRVHVPQAQSSFSWDWGPSLPTLGLWKEVRLEAYDVLRLVHLSSVPVYGKRLFPSPPPRLPLHFSLFTSTSPLALLHFLSASRSSYIIDVVG